MKKALIITIIALLGICREANAQFYVGGSVSAHFGYTDSRFTSFSLSPDIGYSFGDWSVGSTINISTYGDKDDGLTSLRLGITPYAEYYFFSAGPVSLFAEGGIALFFARYLSEGAPENAFYVNPYLAPGIEISLTDHFSVLCHIGRLEWNTEARDFGFSINGEALSLGLYYSF